MVHVPPEQLVLATFLLLSTVHFTPQEPQLLTSLAVWVSQPSVATLLQLLYLREQAGGVASGNSRLSATWGTRLAYGLCN
jgi:hypothetical protein